MFCAGLLSLSIAAAPTCLIGYPDPFAQLFAGQHAIFHTHVIGEAGFMAPLHIHQALGDYHFIKPFTPLPPHHAGLHLVLHGDGEAVIESRAPSIAGIEIPFAEFMIELDLEPSSESPSH